MSKFGENWTKGPWKISSQGKIQAEGMESWEAVTVTGVDVIHAHRNAEVDPEVVANTHLFKASPSLYEALEEIVSVAEQVDSWESFPSAPIEKALNALAQARGES